MSKLSNLVSKGVRLIVSDDEEAQPETAAEAPADRTAHERTPRQLPPEAVTAEPPRSVQRSQLVADVLDFSEVYAEAGIELPLHGYGIDKVGEMLENKRLATMAREVKATAVLAALEAAGVELKDVIQDGVRRDKALDAFLTGKTAETQELRGKSEARVEQIREQIAAFLKEKNTEIEELKKAAEGAVLSLTRLEERKLREEERLHGILSHFIEAAANPITRAKADVPDKPASTS
jgi:dGTP triphosphohydrolase